MKILVHVCYTMSHSAMYLILEKEFNHAEANLQQAKQYGTSSDVARATLARDIAERDFVMRMSEEERGFHETKMYMRSVNQAKWEKEEAEERMREAQSREEFPRKAMKCVEKMADRLDSLHIKMDNARNEIRELREERDAIRAGYEERIYRLEQELAAARAPKVGLLRRLIRRLRN